MCRFWKKLHTCSHLSDRKYIDWCRPGYLSNTICADIHDLPSPRPSHFPCWNCIRTSAFVEAQEKRVRASAVVSARDAAVRVKAEYEKRGREERVRREARENAERERVVDTEGRAEKEKEAERAKVEGGKWTLAEGGSGKKKKAKGMQGAIGSPGAVGKKGMWKENEVEANGRAGTWGPKKILSRKEVSVLGEVGNAVDGTNRL